MDQLLSPKALACVLGVAEQTIYNRHSTGGNLPRSIKLGRLLRFRATDVDAWIAKQPSSSGQQPATTFEPVATHGDARTNTDKAACPSSCC
jgi:predicted DNA-binding transcriptional regulator AlpA